MLETLVLFMLFNRPRKTQRVLERILAAEPRSLFVSADGPRDDHPDDEQKCAKVRELIDAIPPRISTQKLYRKKNLDCKQSGIQA